jgi:hypothetical protein
MLKNQFFFLLLCCAPALAQEDLKGLGFGVGLGFRWNVFKPDLVDEATVDSNGFVRVTKRVNTSANFLLEMHHFPFTFGNKKGSGKMGGTGPFVAVQPGSNQFVTAIGAGWMVGWKLTDGGRGFGLGLGYAALPAARTLGDEFVEGQLAPTAGPEKTPLAIRYQERDKGSVLVVLSFVF